MKREDLEPEDLPQLNKFLEEYPGDSKNEARRLEKAYLAGFEASLESAKRAIVSLLREAANELEADN